MCAKFTNYMDTKSFIDAMENCLPKLTDWSNDKITFWQTDLGSNLLQKSHTFKKCFAVTTDSEQKSEISKSKAIKSNYELRYFNKNRNSFNN